MPWKSVQCMWCADLVPIPPGAIVYYLFKLSNFDDAIKEQVEGINALSTSRIADLNVEQTNTGQVLAFPANTAGFDRGVAMSVPPAATNDLTNSELDGTIGGITDWSTSGVITSVQNSQSFNTVNSVSFSSVADRNYIGQDFTSVLGEERTSSCKIEEITGSLRVRNVLAIFPAGSFDEQYFVNDVAVADTFMVSEPCNIKLITTATANSAASFRAGAGALSNETCDLSVSTPQMEGGVNQTPFIITTTIPETRDATLPSISTFLKPEYWIDSPLDDGGDNPFRSGGTTTGATDTDYIDGVRKSPFSLRFTAGTGIASKYAGLGDAKMTSGVITCSAGIVRITDAPTPSQIDLELITGDFDEVLACLRDEDLAVNWTPSDYFTGNLAADNIAVSGVRTSAGDDLSAFGVPTLWPVNDFVIEFTCTFNHDQDIMIVWENAFEGVSANLYAIAVEISGTTFRFGRRNMADTANVLLPLPVVTDLFGRTFTFNLEQSSTTGATLTVTEVGGLGYAETANDNSADFLADVAWSKAACISQRDGTFPAFLDIIDFTLSPAP